MKSFPLGKLLLLATVAMLGLARTPASAQGVLIDFDGLPSMTYWAGNPIPNAARLSTQFLSTYGVSFSSSADYVAVVDLGAGHATSGTNGIGASTSDGFLTYNNTDPIWFTFFDPAHPAADAVTDFVSVRGDLHGNGSGVSVTLEAFDLDGNLVGSDTQPDVGGETLTINVPNIHAVRFSGVSAGVGGVALDDLRFDLPVASTTLKTLSIAPGTLPGGKNAKGHLVLSYPAPHGGITVSLTSTNSAASVPASLFIASGKTSASFVVTTAAVMQLTTGAITATYNASSQMAPLKVRPIGVQSLALIPNPVKGGNTVTGQVSLELAAAPTDIVVTLKSSNPKLAAPSVSNLTIPAGQMSATFSVATATASATQYIVLSASANGIAKQVKLQINP